MRTSPFLLLCFGSIACDSQELALPAPLGASSLTSSPGLFVSMEPDRSNPRALEESVTLNGPAFVFVDGFSAVKRVDFQRIDAPAVFRRAENLPPYDFVGTTEALLAAAYDFSTLAPGRHELSAVVHFEDGSQTQVSAWFTRGAGAPEICAPPVSLADVSQAQTVVGDGTPQSCTEAALDASLAAGGVITFACGEARHTIALTREHVVSVDTVIDGGGRVTLSGGGRTRILGIHGAETALGPHLVLQRIELRDGRVLATAEPAIPADEEAGAAVFRRGGTLTVIASRFFNHHGRGNSSALGGGAIYAIGGGATTIVDSHFEGNSASNGGALAGARTVLRVFNSVVQGNAAIGDSSRPGDKGSGGGLWLRGAGSTLELCGAWIKNNTARATAGGLYHQGDERSLETLERTHIRMSTIAENSAATAVGGGVVVERAHLAIDASTLSDNTASQAAALKVGIQGTVVALNSTFARNQTTGYGNTIEISYGAVGSLINCTIAGNDSARGAAIGALRSIVLKNTLIASNRRLLEAEGPVACADASEREGGALVQWPAPNPALYDYACAPDAIAIDPSLRGLAHNGGATLTALPERAHPVLQSGRDCPAVDQRGQPRRARCTLGAVEMPDTQVTPKEIFPRFMVSRTPDRADAVPLDVNVALNAEAYVFITGVSDVARVEFQQFDAPSVLRRKEAEAPFDFVGTTAEGFAAPYDFSKLTPGVHSLTAHVVFREGFRVSTRASFRRETSPDYPAMVDGVCTPPAELADVSQPSSVVGAGTPESCTELALQQALDGGGVVTFDCGPAPFVLALTRPQRITRDVVLDGADKVVLSGEGRTRILTLDAGAASAPHLTVQRLTFSRGAADPELLGSAPSPDGGGAISRRGGRLTVVASRFLYNSGSDTSRAGGGAISSVGGGPTTIVASVFEENRAGTGGAVGAYASDVQIVNSQLRRNRTGYREMPDGFGGAVAVQNGRLTLCGAHLDGNVARGGAGVVSSGFTCAASRTHIDRSTLSNNAVTDVYGRAGGMLSVNTHLRVDASTFAGNIAAFAGGVVAESLCSPFSISNTTFAYNASTEQGGGVIAVPHTGTVRNCTFALNERRSGAALVHDYAFPVLKNTLIVSRSAGVPQSGALACDVPFTDGGGVVQWPRYRADGAPETACTSSAAFFDPELGPLTDNGGPTLSVEAASTALMSGVDCPATDQRGRPRASPCKLGALE